VAQARKANERKSLEAKLAVNAVDICRICRICPIPCDTCDRPRKRLSQFRHACKMGLEGIVSKRLGSRYRSGRSPDWLKFKNPDAPAVRREAEEDWGRR
jgi:ATP-dependent DNA ligase